MSETDFTSCRYASSQEWDNIWNSCDYATYFQSREWGNIWKEYSAGKVWPCSRLITFPDGNKVLIPYSVTRISKGMVKKILMSPESSFGGWLSADILNRKQEKSILNYIKNSFPDLFWRLNPYYPSGFKETGLYLRDDTTQAINLSCGMKNILCKWAHGHRSALNKAKKLGVTARVASSKDDWKEYKKLYKDTLKRWGESAIAEYTYRQELFDIFFRLNSPNVKLWLAEYKENVISGYLALYGPKNCILWHSATLERYFELRPTQLIVYEALKDACKNHLNWLDFNPSGPLKGVKVWKQRFGAEELPCPIYIKKSRITLAIETMNAMLHRHPVKMTLNKNPLPH